MGGIVDERGVGELAAGEVATFQAAHGVEPGADLVAALLTLDAGGEIRHRLALYGDRADRHGGVLMLGLEPRKAGQRGPHSVAVAGALEGEHVEGGLVGERPIQLSPDVQPSTKIRPTQKTPTKSATRVVAVRLGCLPMPRGPSFTAAFPLAGVNAVRPPAG